MLCWEITAYVKVVRILLGQLVRKWTFQMLRSDWLDYFMMALKKISCEDRRLMELTQDHPQL
jgi:hypothetical protein